MLLIRCKEKFGQLVLQADRYTWNWIRYREVPNSNPVVFEEIPDGQLMKEGDCQGVGLSAMTGQDWEQVFVSPGGYGQIIVEDENRKTRDNFRLKKYHEKEGLITC